MLSDTTAPPATEEEDLPWQWLSRQVDAAAYHPKADPQVVAERIEEGDSAYYVLKNPAIGAYLKLNEADYNLWQLMDGSRTVKDLVVAHFVSHKTFAYGRIASLVNELKESRFLLDKPVGLYKQAAQQLEEEDWTHRWRKLAGAFVEHLFPIKGIDKYISAIYRGGGFIFYNRIIVLMMWLVALVGLIPFWMLLQMPEQFPIVGISGGSVLAGIVLLIVANTIIIFIHELAHAVTTKHYGREVPSGGAMIYYGMPAFYVNTMDIWLEPKNHRIAVSWSGPFSGIFLGGIFSAIALAWPEAFISQLLFKMAFLGYVGCLVNLNPLLELDGYFILIDWLGIPLLRERAFNFIKTELPGKLKALIRSSEETKVTPKVERQSTFTREEIIFSVYGVLSAVYTVYILWFVFFLWNARVAGLLVGLWGRSGWLGKLALAAVAIAIIIPVVLALGTTISRWLGNGFEWLQKRGFFEREQNIALMTALGLAVSIGLPLIFTVGQTWAFRIWLVLLSLFAVWSLTITARQYAGSEIQGQFWGLVGSAGLLALSTVLFALQIMAGAWLFALLAIFPLALVALVGLNSIDIRRGHRLEKSFMLLLVIIGFTGAIVSARGAGSDVGAFLVGSGVFILFSFLAVMIPVAIAYLQTRFFISWLLLITGVILLGAFNFLAPYLPFDWLRWLLLVTVSFWAVGGFVYASAGWRIRFPAPNWEEGFALAEEERLRHAFIRFFEHIFAGYRMVFGERRAQEVDDALDVIAVTANWGVELDQGRVRDRLDLKKLSILEQANRYQEVLGRAIDLMDNWAGSKFVTRAAQAAYDGLPWPERESLGRYVLAGTSWGAAIAHQFASVRSEQFQLLRGLPMFASCNSADLDRILAGSRRETVSTGAILLKEGKPYPFFALIIAGEIEAWKVDQSTGHSILVGELGRGGAFGSAVFAVSAPPPAQATYRASVPTDMLFVDRKTALRLVGRGINLNNQTVAGSGLGQMLAEMPFFAELSPQQIESLLERMGRLQLAKGKIIVKQGQPRDKFFIIEAGEVGIVAASKNGQPKIVAKLGPGEHFGETSLYTDQPYSATCVALSDVKLLTLDEFTFDRLVATSHQMTHYVEQVSSGRLKDMRRKLGVLGK